MSIWTTSFSLGQAACPALPWLPTTHTMKQQLHGPKFISDGWPLKNENGTKAVQAFDVKVEVLCVSWRAAQLCINRAPVLVWCNHRHQQFSFIEGTKPTPHNGDLCIRMILFSGRRSLFFFSVNHHLKVKSSARSIYVSGVTSPTLYRGTHVKTVE